METPGNPSFGTRGAGTSGGGGKARPGRGARSPGDRPPGARAAGGSGPSSTRDLVHRRLAAQARRFPDLDLAPMHAEGLSDRDAALAYAIEDAVVRRWLTLTHLLNTRLGRPFEELEPKVKAALLAGGAQLLFLDRVPDHAAINESVEWAKRAVRPGAGALVNAVLRKVVLLRGAERRFEPYAGGPAQVPLPDGNALVLAEPVLPHDPAEQLGAATSHPAGLIRRWNGEHGETEARRLALHSLVHAPIILNTAHAGSALPENLVAPHDAAGHHVFTGGVADLAALLSVRGDVWVQDPAAAAAAGIARHLRPRTVLDLCAGQGTKTRQLVRFFPEAEIVATDVDGDRYRTLGETFAREPRVRIMPLRTVRESHLARADLILLDVPCSNTGVLARRPEARYRVNTDAFERILGVQRQIIADSIPLLAPGGSILYSTCSIEREENEGMAEWARKWHRFKIRFPRTALPRGSPGDPPTGYADGSFSCLLTA